MLINYNRIEGNNQLSASAGVRQNTYRTMHEDSTEAMARITLRLI